MGGANMKHFHLYILKDKIPVGTDDVIEWGTWLAEHKEERIVARTDVVTSGGVLKTFSTVFIMVDHGFGGKPQLFETVLLGPTSDCVIVDRYSTWVGAEAGHHRLVKNFIESGGVLK